MMSNNVLYSICMCNYNMADTIEQSLASLLKQLDDRFEVVLVDDGSSDESVAIAKTMQMKHPNLRIVALPRDQNRKLGKTRNISIAEAQGEYVLLHLDCDDVFGPYLTDFVEVFHRVESCLRRDILLSGQHINMSRRDFLLSHGPYLNMYRGEDRNLWSRMAKINAWIPLDHIDFITRLPKNIKKKTLKNIFDTFDHMKNDFRSGVRLSRYFKYEIEKRNQYSIKLFLFRLIMLLPSWFFALFEEPISQDGTLGGVEEFADYRERIRGTYGEIMHRNGCDPSLIFLKNKEAMKIFEISGVNK
jgi:glycosyltransferase involved in cell wall biosynthesis